MAGAPSAERSWSSNDAHDPPSHDIELHGAALSDGGLPSGPGKDTTRLLEQQEDGTDKCVGVTCKPQVSSLAAASLGVNGIFFGMLIVLSVGRSAHNTAADPASADSMEAALLQGARCDRAAPDRSRAACGGNGVLFDDAEACVCFDCWGGPTCAEPLSRDDCVVQAGSGTPYLFEDYWLAHPEPTLVLRPSYHLGYSPFERNPLADTFGETAVDDLGAKEIRAVPRLERAVRELHALVGNAELDGMHLVFGVGSTQLVNAALYALAQRAAAAAPAPASAPAAAVWAAAPYYGAYVDSASYIQSRLFGWQDGMGSQPPEPSREQPVIEMVTSPNNPDGATREARVTPSEHTYTVYDHVYFWPHFTPITGPVTDHVTNRSVALFSLSKLTGHASTRIGWAVCRSAEVAALMRHFILVNTLHVPRESQLRAAAALEHVVTTQGQLLGYARSLMLSRWERLQACFEGSTAFKLQALEPAAKDGFTGQEEYPPSPAYAWVRQVDGGDAAASLKAAGVVGRSGTAYGAGEDFVRIELLMREQTFGVMLEKLRRMHGHAA